MRSLEALLLYGSKARGDNELFSDTDLLGVIRQGRISKQYDENGITLHIYPLEWLIEQSRAGSLFLLHICRESVPLFDNGNIRRDIVSAFNCKTSYKDDVRQACRIISATLNVPGSLFSQKIKRRYFWALRTALIASSADLKTPTFSALALEQLFSIRGLALHVQGRSTASQEDCTEFGFLVHERLLGMPPSSEPQQIQANLKEMFLLGGLDTATAGEITYGM